ncbi:MAG: histidine kinase [Micrococcus sp.]|nr:histidine kinase [Micrococcus sp.]
MDSSVRRELAATQTPETRFPRWLRSEPVRGWIRIVLAALIVLGVAWDLFLFFGTRFTDLDMSFWLEDEVYDGGMLLASVLSSALCILLLWQVSLGAVATLVWLAASVGLHAATNIDPELLLAPPLVTTWLAAPLVARYSERRFAAISAAVFVVLAGLSMIGAPLDPDGIVTIMMVVVAGLLVIPALIVRRARMRARAQLAALEEARRRAEAAAESERQRIATELHDVVAHGLTIISMQAAMLQTTTDHEARTRSQGAIESAARQSLVDLRRMLTALRGSDRNLDSDQEGGVPDLGARLEDLVSRLEAAGFTVTRDLDSLAGLAPSLELTVLRVLQEATTNVLKHAGLGEVHMSAHRDDAGHVVLDVRSPLPRVEPALAAATTSRTAGQRREWAAPSSGFGLPGMRERVAVFGGSLTAEPSGSHWVVRATLPIR